jgi:hypothetical protein
VSRTKRQVSPSDLRQVIEKLEREQKFVNRSELFQAVANTPWGKINKVTPSVVYLRIKEFGIQPVTPKGKQGNPGLKGNAGPRKPRKVSEKAAAALRKEAKYYNLESLAEEALSGSRKSCIKLNCLLCAGGIVAEVRNCQVFSCAMYSVRPFRGNSDET